MKKINLDTSEMIGLHYQEIQAEQQEIELRKKFSILQAWKHYRGSNEGYLLTSSEAFSLLKETGFNKHIKNLFERLIVDVMESIHDRYYDC